MNQAIKAILERRSTRAYEERKVPLSKLNQVLEAGKMAPSAMNRQIGNILAVRSKKLVERLRQASLEITGRDCFYGANTMIIVYGPRGDRFTKQDCSCILENMFVAATALKLQSCWINQVDDILSNEKEKRLRKSLGIPEEMEIVGTCIVGYAKDGIIPDPKARKDDFVVIK